MKSVHHLTTSIEQRDSAEFQFVVHLVDERQKLDIEIAFGDLYESPELAEASIPPVLADSAQYERAVERAIERINRDPCEVFATFAYDRGVLRSVQHAATYDLGALYAYPIVENLEIGMPIYFNERAALDAAHHEARLFGVIAVTRCKAGNVENAEGTYLTDALIPTEIEYIVVLSPTRVREDGTVEVWDSANMGWLNTNKKYVASPYDVVEFVESDRGKFGYIMNNVYRCP